MADSPSHARLTELLALLRECEQTFAANQPPAPVSTVELRSTLARIETETPGGAPLHSQLDNVRKWLDALDDPEQHERFGGTTHVSAYVLTQLRLALGALEDYQREM
jgi:hypothetical protein